jgi:hypothetical protein
MLGLIVTIRHSLIIAISELTLFTPLARGKRKLSIGGSKITNYGRKIQKSKPDPNHHDSCLAMSVGVDMVPVEDVRDYLDATQRVTDCHISSPQPCSHSDFLPSASESFSSLYSWVTLSSNSSRSLFFWSCFSGESPVLLVFRIQSSMEFSSSLSR